MGEHTQWLFWFVAIILAAYGFALHWWALFADRNLDRRRCSRCWYDMTGTPGLTCPECGRTYRSEARLRRRRPRWGLAACGLLILFAAAIAFHVGRVGYRWMVPNAVLVWAAPRPQAAGGTMREELMERIAAERLTDEQLARLVERSIEQGNTPWTIEVVTRDTWPSDQPISVAVRFDRPATGLPWLDDVRMRLRLEPASVFGAEPLLLYADGSPNETFTPIFNEVFSGSGVRMSNAPKYAGALQWNEFAWRIGIPSATTEAMVFDATVELDAAIGRGTDFIPVWTERIEVPVTIATGGEPLLARISEPRGTSAAEYLGLNAQPARQSGPRRVEATTILVQRASDPEVPIIEGMLVALRLELLFDGTIVADGRLVSRDSVTAGLGTAVVDLAWRSMPVDFSGIAEEDEGRWTMRALVDEATALSAFDAESLLWFEGSIDVPITWWRRQPLRAPNRNGPG
jgi:hypothetical protein